MREDLKQLQKMVKAKHPEWTEDKAKFIAQRLLAA